MLDNFNLLLLRTKYQEKLLKNRDMVKAQFLAGTEIFIRENGDGEKNMGREPRTIAPDEFFISVSGSGVLERAPLVVIPMGKENGSIVKLVTYMKDIFPADSGRVRERCITGMEIFIEENGVTIRNMVSER